MPPTRDQGQIPCRSALALRSGRAAASAVAVLLVMIEPAFAYQQEIRAAALRVAESLTKSGRKTVAVVDFTDLQGNVTELGRFLAEQLSVTLAGEAKDFEVVDRAHLKTLLQEHKLSSTGLIDPQTARKLGQIAGVEALVTGSITPFGDSVSLSVKVLDTTTAKMIGASNADIPKTRAIEELLARGIGSGSGPASGPTAGPDRGGASVSATMKGPSAGSPKPASQPEFVTESYRLSVESATKNGPVVTLVMVLEATGAETLDFKSNFWEPWRLLDGNGEEWLSDGEDPGGFAARGVGPGIQLPPGTKRRSRVAFTTKGPFGSSEFTLTAKEFKPKDGRRILLRGIRTN